MARSRAIDTRLEKLAPSMEEYIVTGLFDRNEVNDIVKRRTDFEYRLVARPVLLLDVKECIQYEMSIEAKLAEYAARTQLTFKHRWVVLDRVEQTYRIGLKHLRDPVEREALRGAFTSFLRDTRRITSLSRHYAELLVAHPLHAPYWAEAAVWEAEMGEFDNARVSVQRAVELLPQSVDVYVAATTIELLFVDKMLRTVAEEHRERAQLARKNKAPDVLDVVDYLRGEHASLAAVVLDLQLCRVVVDAVFARGMKRDGSSLGSRIHSPATNEDHACTPEFALRVLSTALRFPFARALCEHVMTSAARQVLLHVAAASEGRGTGRSGAWCTDAGGSQVLLALADLEHTAASRAVTDAPEFLRELASGTKKRRVQSDVLRLSFQWSLQRSIALLYAPAWRVATCLTAPAAPSGEVQAYRSTVATPLQTHIVELLTVGSDAASRTGQKPLKRVSTTLPPDVQRDILTVLLQHPCPVAGGATEFAELMTAICTRMSVTHVPQSEADVESGGASLRGVNATVERLSRLMQQCGLVEADNSAVATTLSEASASRSVPNYVRLEWPTDLVLRVLTPDELLRMEAPLSESPQTSVDGTPRPTSASVTESELQRAILQAQQGTLVLMQWLKDRHLIRRDIRDLGGVTSADALLQPTTHRRLPQELWRLFLAAEEQEQRANSSTAVPENLASEEKGDTSSDEGDVPRRNSRGGARHEPGVKLTCEEVSPAVLGLQFLASFGAYAKKTQEEAEAYCEGVYHLLRVRVCSVCNVSVLDREHIASQLSHGGGEDDGGAPKAVVRVQRLFSFAQQRCAPLPRPVLTHVILPVLEANAMHALDEDPRQVPSSRRGSAGGSAAAAIKSARLLHESIVRLFSAPGVAATSTSPASPPKAWSSPLLNLTFPEASITTTQSFKGKMVDAAALNSQDWIRYVEFERVITKDFVRSQEVAHRAQKESLDPKQVSRLLRGGV